jgi:hypothetical protein
LTIDPAKLVSSLSYSHFELLVEIEDPLELPKKEEMQKFIEEQMREVQG